jgi:ABC-2 type transport system ATP-binding protein
LQKDDFEKEVKVNMSTSFVIETHELSKTYKNVQALRSLDLKVQQNSIFGFLGPNAAGKTTTIKLLLGLTRPPTSPRRIHPIG